MARKTALAATIDRAMKSMSRQIVVAALKEVDASTNLGRLWEEFGAAGYRNHLKELTLGEIAEAVAGNKVAAPSSAGRQPKAAAASGVSSGRGRARTFRTRTIKGRAAIDAAVSAYLQKNGTSGAEFVRKEVGGTSAQIRESLARLVAEGKVTRTGERRATRYTWGGGGSAAAPAAKAKGAKKKKRRTRKTRR